MGPSKRGSDLENTGPCAGSSSQPKDQPGFEGRPLQDDSGAFQEALTRLDRRPEDLEEGQQARIDSLELAAHNERLQARVDDLELARSEFVEVLESSDVTLLLIDPQLRIANLASSTRGPLELRADDVGRSFDDVDAKLSGGVLAGAVRQVMEEGAMMTRHVTVDDGRVYLCRIVSQVVPAGFPRGAAVTVREVTRLQRLETDRESTRSQLEKTVERRTGLIDLMHQVAHAANCAATVEEVIVEVVPELCRAIGAELGLVWLIDDENPAVLVQTGPAFVGDVERLGDLLNRFPHERSLTDDGLVSRVINEQYPAGERDLGTVLEAELADAAKQAGLCSVVLVPIVAGDRTSGLLEVFCRSPLDQPNFIMGVVASVGSEIGRVVERADLQQRISDISDEEQRRIGQELHDTVAQEVAGIRMLAEALLQRMGKNDADRKLVSELATAAAQAQSHVRSLARGLVPLAIDAGGLRAAIEQLVERLSHEHDIVCEFCNPEQLVVQDSRLATNLYYIAQEALRNAVQHGGASRTLVELAVDDETLVLRVSDDGQGFDRSAVIRKVGSGLRIMAYRARLVGGDLRIASDEREGTKVSCVVPERQGRSLWKVG